MFVFVELKSNWILDGIYLNPITTIGGICHMGGYLGKQNNIERFTSVSRTTRYGMDYRNESILICHDFVP